MTVCVSGDRDTVKPRLAVLAWAVAVVSLAGFAAVWVLAATNRDLLDISADSSPDRFLIAYAIVGAVLASRRLTPSAGCCSASAWYRQLAGWRGNMRCTRWPGTPVPPLGSGLSGSSTGR